ncbi:HEAT repeat domain-containing protein [Aquisphaera insulae]|uniref:HEAT repeat domain-containing protein n=1 Tax=Aquisphaera insulae TaxID=2712864 RepID=UPI0013EB7ABB|nr:HEAT repeat domain-containing protein [Aquisphaera insulae]
MGGLLDGLDDVDWGRLSHAYGRAGDVPGFLRALASPDPEGRRKGLGDLRWTICHQGSRYRASAPAVPFLFEVLEAPGTQDRAAIVGLLASLAVGYQEWHVPLGFDPDGAFVEAGRLGQESDLDEIRAAEPDEDEDDGDPGRLNLWEKDTYEAVLSRVDVFRRLAADEDRDVRLAAVKALAWFPAAGEASLALVRGVAREQADPDERANAIFCLGILGHVLHDDSDASRMGAELSPDRPAAVRIAAAISMGVLLGREIPDEALAVLLDAAQDLDATDAAGKPIPWHWLGLGGHASAVIRHVRPAATAPTLAALSRASEKVTEPMGGAELFAALLSVVFPDGDAIPTRMVPPSGFPQVDPMRLTRAQAEALRAIGRAPVWRKEPFFYGRLMDVGLEFHLPWDPKRYRELVEAVEEHVADHSPEAAPGE